jgi:glutamate/tyrosine decarboxylase-like PLP-dependent enzyme
MAGLTAFRGTAEASPANDVSAGLFPSARYRKGADDRLTQLLSEAAGQLDRGGVAATTDYAAAAAALARFDFSRPSDLNDVLGWVVRRMQSGMTQVSHQRYFGLFNPTPSFPAQCADRIVAQFNPQLASATTSPFPVAVERHVIRAMAGRLDMPSSTMGHFTSGGSEANATAVICALTRAEPEYGQRGLYAFKGRPLLYVSKDAHLAWLKIAHQTGIGREAVRLVATDGKGRMNGTALSEAIAADRAAGHVPVLVVSTAGTTGAGVVDDMTANASIARREGAWHHVDAAWGGALAVSDRLRHVLRGIECADSVTIDAHKWLAVTMGCGMFITAHPAVLSDAFHVTMDCMPSNAADLDPYVTTMQWSRRFLGLRLFVALATAGWSGYAEFVERSVQLSEMLRDSVIRRGWDVVNDSPLAVTCLRPPPGARKVQDIAQDITASGEAWISTVEFEGEKVIRVCMTSGQTTGSDVARLVGLLDRHSRGH